MNTPIYSFLMSYQEKTSARLHMPAHKGKGALGCEGLDLTEVFGADVLYSPSGIIEASERNASGLFGSEATFYSTEGSTLCIKAMLRLATEGVEKPLLLAGRNAHKSFINACALLGIDVAWLYPEETTHLCSCRLTPEEVERAITDSVTAVYLTSPDYLGGMADVKGISEVCHRHNVPLLVDNAHGAYLKFLPKSLHPIDLGADMCCDSAHKTLPVLTGGAYLHVMRKEYAERANGAFSLFASTSPSYLTLASLDLCNRYLSEGYRERLAEFILLLSSLKGSLEAKGYKFIGDEPMKLTLDAADYGYTGYGLGEILREKGIECEFSDREYLVLMPSPENGKVEMEFLQSALASIEKKEAIKRELFRIPRAESGELSIRSAVLSRKKTVALKDSFGKICASPTVSCPPAVPIAVSGERISSEHIRLFEYYGISEIEIVEE